MAWFWTEFNTYLEAIGLGLIGWVAWEVKVWLAAHATWMSADTQAKAEATLDAGLRDGLAYGLQLAAAEESKVPGPKLPGGVKGWVLGEALTYVETHFATEMDTLGLSPDQVTQRLLAKLPSTPTLIDSTGPAPAIIPVEVKTLEPVAPPSAGSRVSIPGELS